ncbi:MAG TPA: hypothetical protein VMR98_00600 [Candidatus Polarisedimenticolaceae bacterium]|nr:hypothetical protein [Candidatus Polarisedimenticolaceae bacterium]
MRAIKRAVSDVQATTILGSEATPINKVRQLVAIGYEEEVADMMVSGVQSGQHQMLYYEQLPRADYADE